MNLAHHLSSPLIAPLGPKPPPIVRYFYPFTIKPPKPPALLLRHSLQNKTTILQTTFREPT
jgi:hypothetical protein